MPIETIDTVRTMDASDMEQPAKVTSDAAFATAAMDVVAAEAVASGTTAVGSAVPSAAATEAAEVDAAAIRDAGALATDEACSSRARQPEVQIFSAAAHRVVKALTAMSDGSGAVLCTKAQLAKRMGSCLGTADHGVQELRKAGYLEVVPRFDESGAQLGNCYRVLGDIGGYVERRGRPSKGTRAASCTK